MIELITLQKVSCDGCGDTRQLTEDNVANLFKSKGWIQIEPIGAKSVMLHAYHACSLECLAKVFEEKKIPVNKLQIAGLRARDD